MGGPCGAARTITLCDEAEDELFISLEIQVGADLSRLGVGRVPYRNFNNFVV